MKLRHDNTLSAVDDERALLGHVRDIAEEHFLFDRLEILVILIVAGEAQFCLEGYGESQAPVDALIDVVLGRIDGVINKLEDEVFARVGNGEVLCKYFEETLILSFLGRCFNLQEIFEGLKLEVEEIGIVDDSLDVREVNPVVDGLLSQGAMRFKVPVLEQK